MRSDLRLWKKFTWICPSWRAGLILPLLLLSLVVSPSYLFAAGFTNRILTLSSLQDQNSKAVKIVAEKEIGSRYTSYLLSKPPRIVFDFQGADITVLPALTKLTDHPVSEMRVSLYESAAVKSGRIELILTNRVPYKVKIDGNALLVTFSSDLSTETAPADVFGSKAPLSQPAPPAGQTEGVKNPSSSTVEVAAAAAPPQIDVEKPAVNIQNDKLIVTTAVPLVHAATQIEEIISRKGEVYIRANGTLDQCKSFSLNDPARFVVDCASVNKSIPGAITRLAGPVKVVRTAVHPDKVRFVLEGDAQGLSKIKLFPIESGLSLRYDGKVPATIVTKPETEDGKLNSKTETTSAKEEKTEVPSAPAKSEMVSARQIKSIVGRQGEVFVSADGALDQFKTFSISGPSRFVVDLFGATESTSVKSLRLNGSVNQVRIGRYPDMVRLVFEGEAKAIAKIKAFTVENGLSLRYDGSAPANSLGSKAVPVPPAHEVSVAEPISTAIAVKTEPGADVPKPQKITPVAEKSAPPVKLRPLAVEMVDFKVEDDKSYVIVTLSAAGEVMQPIKDKTLLRFGIKGATINPALRRTIDASAFPSVVRQITPYSVNSRGQSDVRFAVELKGDAPFQLKNDGKIVTLIIENGRFNQQDPVQDDTIEIPLEVKSAPVPTVARAVAPEVVKSEASVQKARSEVISNETIKIVGDKKYTGQSVSLNFDNIEIRNVLLLIAEVSDTNIIANEDVKGTITLRLNNVPWDQALDVIMESKGLGMEQEGNILRIAPKEVILQRKLDKAKMETELSDKSPNVTKAFSLSYGPVDDIAKKIEEHLKGKGFVSADARTRQVIVTTTQGRLNEIEEQIIKRLDTPDQQVTIEARIVEANSNFTRDLGVSWGISQQGTAKGPWDLSGAMITGGGSFTINPGTQATNTTGPVFNSSAGLGSQFSFGRIGIDSTILDLRLSALEASGYGKIVSTPRITTSNGEAAEISQGTQIPYQSTSDKGTETKFIDATLSLKVKPVINPDDSMILEIEVSNDSIGSTVATGVGSAPSINTKKAKTKVLVKNGETTVIGGIFIETEFESESGIPILRSIPIIGYLFKSTKKSKDKTELMIFITPRIVQ